MNSEHETNPPRDTRAGTEGQRSHRQSYGDLTELNSTRIILDSAGKDLLTEIAEGFVRLLGTSLAIYERNGDYAFGIFTSGWCRFLDERSRQQCGTNNNRKAMTSGRWHCHESCWATSRVAIDTGEPADRECLGGIRLYAVPIYAGGEVVGAINVGYGDPPSDPRELEDLANRYGLSVEELMERGRSYESRPPWIIDVAKCELKAAARAIGEIVQRKRADEALRRAHAELERRVAERTAELSRANAALREEATERKQAEAELHELHSELARVTRLHTLGAMVAEIAHDLNQPLETMANFAFAAEKMVDKNASGETRKLRSILQKLSAEALRTADIVTRIRALVEKTERQHQRADVNELINDVLKLVETELSRKGIDLRLQLGQPLPSVSVDAIQIQQVILNLVRNAIEAMEEAAPDRRCLTITTSSLSGDAVEVAVFDSGKGLSAKEIGHIFDAFFTTKKDGLGMGLSVSRSIIESHGGRIWGERPAGGGPGTTVRFTLPLGPRSECQASAAGFLAAHGVTRVALIERLAVRST
jgi:signal transduction histidine kinase